MHIPPESDPVWSARAAAIIDYLEANPGADFGALARAFRRRTDERPPMGPHVLRHALAAAHPLALELDGRWYTATHCARPRRLQDRDAAPETIIRYG